MTNCLTLNLYNFAHFHVAIVKSLTAIALVWYWAARAQLLVPVLNVPDLVSRTVTATTCAYCPVPFHLPYWASMSNSETLLERHQWRERETTAAETWDERATTLCHLGVAISLMLAPQCSTISLVIYHGCMWCGLIRVIITCSKAVSDNVNQDLTSSLPPLTDS